MINAPSGNFDKAKSPDKIWGEIKKALLFVTAFSFVAPLGGGEVASRTEAIAKAAQAVMETENIAGKGKRVPSGCHWKGDRGDGRGVQPYCLVEGDEKSNINDLDQAKLDK